MGTLDGDDEKKGRMFGGVGIYLYLCGAVCGTFAAIDGCDETREQPRTAADETKGGRARMAADEMQRGQARMAAIWIMKMNE